MIREILNQTHVSHSERSGTSVRNVRATRPEALEARIAPAFAAVIELSALTGVDGFQINGESQSNRAGRSVSAAGDINGDGIDDLIISASGQNAELALGYVVFGTTSGFSNSLELSSLDGNNGFQVQSKLLNDVYGREVSAAGDVNGDGVDDLIIGSPIANPNGPLSGACYVVFGRSGSAGFSSSLDVSNLDGTNGFQINGEPARNRLGVSVSAAGDIDGDGIDDLIIGADRPNNLFFDDGPTYVVFGRSQAEGIPPILELSLLNGSNGFEMSTGRAVSGVGDVNGDGVDDVIIGASGASYVVFGKTGTAGFSSSLDLSSLSGLNGFRISGETSGDKSGYSVSGAGDINGDGVDDLIIGAYRANSNGNDSGASYVLFGRRGISAFGAIVQLSLLDGPNGFKISGENPEDRSGISVSAAGDVNGDGVDDLIIGAYRASPNGEKSGASYVVFGRLGASGFSSNLNLSDLNGSNGFQINGEAAGDYSGVAVSAAGDINGDGWDDVIIGADRASPNGTRSGAGYVVFGRPPAITMSVSGAVVDEGDSGTVNMVFTVTLSGTSAKEVSVTVATVEETATAGLDFIALPPTVLTFAPLETSKTVSIPVIGDSLVDPGETFALILSDAVGATIRKGGAVGLIVDADLLVKRSSLSFTDIDGDRITFSLGGGGRIIVTDVHFHPDGTVAAVDLTRFAVDGLSPASEPIDLTVTATTPRGSGGDGLVNIGLIDATGVDLGTVRVSGNVDQILAGDGSATRRAAIQSLSMLGTLGPADGGDGVMNTELSGNVGSLTIRGGVRNASINIEGKAGHIRIDGDLLGEGGMAMGSVQEFAETGRVRGIESDLPAGAIVASSIKNFTVKGNVTGASITTTSGGVGNVTVRGNMTNSSLVSAGVMRVVKIFGDLVSDDPNAPTIITALATLNPKSASRALGISALTVGGDVENAQILVGFNDMRLGLNPDASVGRVTVNGNWIASSLSAGIFDDGADGFGQNDINIAESVVDRILARIASIVINGTATGSVANGDHFGIVAEHIGAARINNQKVLLTKNVADNFLIGPEFGSTTGDFRLVEITRPA